MPLVKPIDEMTKADLQSLIDNKEAEKQTLDYKQELKLDIQQNKDEFRRDISSFANASGGDYILGMKEENGFPVEMKGMQLPNPDAFKLRLEELLQFHITPRIPGVQIRPIEIQGGNYVTIIRIPRSFARPHQVTVNKDDYQFWSRNAAGKYRLNVDELRTGFLLSETLEERIRNFRRERLGSIVAGETPAPMSEKPKLVLHLVPLSAFEASAQLDLSRSRMHELNRLGLLHENRLYHRYNFDGLISSREIQGITDKYVQLFRNGIIESVEESSLLPEYEEQLILPFIPFEHKIMTTLPNYVEFQRSVGIDAPILLMLSLLGVKGYTIFPPSNLFDSAGRPIDRDALIVPEQVIGMGNFDAGTILRPIFDAVWNAGGYSSCPNYNEHGKWVIKAYG